MTTELRQDRPSKPVIYFHAGFWRVTHMPKAVAKGNKGSRQPWLDAHKVVHRMNQKCTVVKAVAAIEAEADDVKLLTTSDLVLIKLRNDVQRYLVAQSAIIDWPHPAAIPDSMFADELRCRGEVEASLQAADNYVIGELGNQY